MGLPMRERAILDLERCSWQLEGPKEAAIRAHLRMSPTRYYELLAALIDKPDAFAYDPLTVKRLRRNRAERRRARLEGRHASPRA